jgi:hypothetical protein
LLDQRQAHIRQPDAGKPGRLGDTEGGCMVVHGGARRRRRINGQKAARLCGARV